MAELSVVRATGAVRAARIWHGVVAVVVLAALVLQLVLLFVGGEDANSGQDTGAVGLGTRLWRFFSYFTVESNLWVLVAAALLVVDPLRDGRVWRVVRLNSLLGILITGVVYAVVLAPIVQVEGWGLVATTGLHYIAPPAAVLGWLVFGPRPRLTWATVAAAFVWPVLWLGYIFTQGAVTGWYPYPFLDAGLLGFPTALRNALLVLVVGIGCAVGFKLLDARLPAPLS
ncbi:MAG TPA: Pr6Pr family membrane protein [Microlunatus sp.]|nr:Pr6Pr family membrane protein [Microlunatus sp.]